MHLIFHVFFIIIFVNGSDIIIYKGYSAAVRYGIQFLLYIMWNITVSEIIGVSIMKVSILILVLCIGWRHDKNPDIWPVRFDFVKGYLKSTGKCRYIIRIVRIIGRSSNIIVRTVIHDQKHIHLGHVHGLQFFYCFQISGIGLILRNGLNRSKLVLFKECYHII